MSRADDANAPTLDIAVNGQLHTLRACSTLADLIDSLDHGAQGTATAVNGEFVARSMRHRHVLRAGDRVTCFQAIVGG